MSAIKSLFGEADISINNTRLGYDKPLLIGNTVKWRDILEVNVLGLCVMTRVGSLSNNSRGVAILEIQH